MRYRTTTGAVLELSRLPRQAIDAYLAGHPGPEPPRIAVPIFGGATEWLEDVDDPRYREQLATYHLQLAQDEFVLISQAVQLLEPQPWQLALEVTEWRELGVGLETEADYLRCVALGAAADMTGVIEALLYLSTVTLRGLQEAEAAFGIQYQGIALSQHPNPPGQVSMSPLFQARLAATALGYTWEAFCELDGPAQSAAVAQYLCTEKLRWLLERDSERRAKVRRSNR